MEKGELAGFNVTAGGGVGVTHGNKKTYPRTADVHARKRGGGEDYIVPTRQWEPRGVRFQYKQFVVVCFLILLKL